MSVLAEVIIAATGVLGTVGVAARFVWLKIEARFVMVEHELAHCRRREAVSGQRRAGHMLAIELLLQEVQRLSPQRSRVLARVQKLLDQLARLDTDEEI